MTPPKVYYHQAPDLPSSVVREDQIEYGFIGTLQRLKYEYRPDIIDRTTLEANFREKFEDLNRVRLTDGELARLLDEIITPDVFAAAKLLRQINSFTRDDGTPLNYTLVNIKDWCKNTFEVIRQLRINTDNSHHRYDVLILINGIPCVQIELKTLTVNPRRAMEQIVDYKNDPGNGYSKTLLCFLHLFIVSNRTNTYYFANNNARHFAFNADERLLPIYQFADEKNKKITHLDDFAATFLVKCTLGRTISRYMVLIASEQKLLMMRPYQVYQVKNIVQCIHDDSGNGYIWSTTGSGKTLTSFKAPVVIQKLELAVKDMDGFMKSQGLACAPEAVPNLKGDEARAAFINHFKEVQRLKTLLDQYTDLTEEDKQAIAEVLPPEDHQAFRGVYLETAQRLRAQQKAGNADVPPGASPIDQIDFEFVLFASAVIDYDYIMGLISRFSQQQPGKQKMTREQLIGLIQSDAKFIDEREDIAEYISKLKAGEGLSETAIRDGYTGFKAEKDAAELATIATRHQLATAALQTFVDGILQRMIFDGEHLSDLMAPLELGWKARSQAELALMADLHPLLTKRAGGRDISGLSAYE